jgi:hypothetical protein
VSSAIDGSCAIAAASAVEISLLVSIFNFQFEIVARLPITGLLIAGVRVNRRVFPGRRPLRRATLRLIAPFSAGGSSMLRVVAGASQS